MKLCRAIFAFIIATRAVDLGWAQSPPPNDNYVDRITLQGTDITFTGTLAGATREEDPYEVVPFRMPGMTQSVWWEWTPAESSTVVFQFLDRSPVSEDIDGVEFWRLQNVWTGYYVTNAIIDTRAPYNFVTFQVEAGTNYQIQLAGSDGATVTMRILATNIPVIIEHPKSQTITADDSVMFGVLVAGAQPFAYQWQRNGTNLVGETAAVLGLDHVTTDQAGTYRVAVSNAATVVWSQPAELVVTATDTAPTLKASLLSSNRFELGIIGEVGRRYKIESSTNMVDWVEEFSFPTKFHQSTDYDVNSEPQPRSVVFNSTGVDSFRVPRGTGQKFYRAHPFHAVNEECNNALKKIRYGQLIYLYNDPNGFFVNNSMTERPISDSLKNHEFPQCPSGEHLWVSVAISNPRCALHPFEEP